jgi:DNA-binding transcriptional LysR family regulator
MNLQTIDLNLLLVFESLMSERNVTRAARRLGLSQPAMSNALTRLRRTFDDPLFLRTTSGMTPTPLAQSLSRPVSAALAQLREALEEKREFDPAASEHVFHLLSNDYAELLLLPALLQSLHKHASHIRLRFHRPRTLFELPTASALTDSFDMAIGFYADTLTLDSSIRSEKLWEEKNVCIAGERHPTIRGKITLRQYAEAARVAVFYKDQGPGVIDTLLAQKGYNCQAAIQVPHFASIPFAVADSELIAAIPERLAIKFREQLKLQVLPLPLNLPPFRLTLLWHERFHNDQAHQWLRGLILEQCATDLPKHKR